MLCSSLHEIVNFANKYFRIVQYIQNTHYWKKERLFLSDFTNNKCVLLIPSVSAYMTIILQWIMHHFRNVHYMSFDFNTCVILFQDGRMCHDNHRVCHHGGTCVDDASSSVICLCPEGFMGMWCEMGKII